MLTEKQTIFFTAALGSEDVRKFIGDVWWPMYDYWREHGELPKIDPGNPHINTAIFALVGYVFSNRNALTELDGLGIEAVVEKLSGGTVKSAWMP